jgi:uncharacterized protein YggU (UPF0235/DUF167 family)
MKRFTVYLHPSSSKNKLEKLSDSSYKIYITEHPIDGEANEAFVELLADELGVSKSTIKIVQGLKSKTKIVEVDAVD